MQDRCTTSEISPTPFDITIADIRRRKLRIRSMAWIRKFLTVMLLAVFLINTDCLQAPKNTATLKGDVVSLICEQPSIQDWQHRIEESDVPTSACNTAPYTCINNTGVYILQITSITAKEAGIYTCKATPFTSASVIVFEHIPTCVVTPSSIRINDTVQVSCSVDYEKSVNTGNDPVLTLTVNGVDSLDSQCTTEWDVTSHTRTCSAFVLATEAMGSDFSMMCTASFAGTSWKTTTELSNFATNIPTFTRSCDYEVPITSDSGPTDSGEMITASLTVAILTAFSTNLVSVF